MPDAFAIEGVTAVGPEGLLPEAWVRVEGGHIVDVRAGPGRNGVPTVDGRGKVLLPGFVDLHSDAIEKEIEPRPRTYFPLDYALHELDKRLAACGVTTSYHSISFAEGEIGTRSNETATRIVGEVERMAGSHLRVRTRVHARFEITDRGAVPILERLMGRGAVQLLSFMDHTPGQGQFREVTSFKRYYGTVYGKSDAELDGIIEAKLRSQVETAPESVRRLLARARAHGVALASHDVDSREKVTWLREQGIRITEFPVNMEAARASAAAGIRVMLGSPNVLRGASQGGNLSAREAIAGGHGDLLCSDYAPQTLLHAVFLLDRTGLLPLHRAARLASTHAAEALGLGERTGSIAAGKEADLVLVDASRPLPQVLRTWVGGREVYRAG